MFLDFDALAASCAPHVAASTLRAMASVESGFNPHAIGVVKGHLTRQPQNLPEAISTAVALRENGTKFSAGLIQIYVSNWPGYNLDHESVFEPCANMRAAAGILTACYQRATVKNGQPQVALRHALSCYYSNNFVTGYQHGYVQKVVATALNFDAIARSTARSGTSTSKGVIS
jgi:type IV secretion system protein VirB1